MFVEGIMINVLLLEPNYKNKYPPLGLMKISYFHKTVRNDYVLFAKGEIKSKVKIKKWDRVYVTTLFTFEWEETKKTIEFALKVAKTPKCVFVGGILASLMPGLVKSIFPDINIVEGQLNKAGKIGYDDDDCIDCLTPDYSILDDISDHYKYAADNAYIMYTTRGCGMKCGFCAVQTLEPKYIPFVPIAEQVENIKTKYGEKRDLLLMDNNVLKSPRFNDIVEEIKQLGFGKGATYRNPLTGKINKRCIDFNQGLDAFLITEEKAKKLSELEIVPARIAFDHIEDKDVYINAIKLCAKYGITELSNYILYNSEDFGGKNQKYKADKPEDLYNRLKISIDIIDEINNDFSEDNKVALFSFPMRYIPLQDTKRGYVGSNWNPKYLRAVQIIMIPTQGKGVSSRPFFNAAFGETLEEFMDTLAMPEEIISKRGYFVEKKDETELDRQRRHLKWQRDIDFRNEWLRLFNELGPQKEAFLNIICHNDLNVEKNYEIYTNQADDLFVKLLLHYLNENKLLKLFKHIDDRLLRLVYQYIFIDFPQYFEKISEYVYATTNKNYAVISNYLRVFGKDGMKSLLELWVKDEFSNSGFLEYAYKIQQHAKVNYFDFTLLNGFKLFS